MCHLCLVFKDITSSIELEFVFFDHLAYRIPSKFSSGDGFSNKFSVFSLIFSDNGGNQDGIVLSGRSNFNVLRINQIGNLFWCFEVVPLDKEQLVHSFFGVQLQNKIIGIFIPHDVYLFSLAPGNSLKSFDIPVKICHCGFIEGLTKGDTLEKVRISNHLVRFKLDV